MINIYDFIRAHSSSFDQLRFGDNGDIFIDYLCPIKENKARVWTDMNCLMYVMEGAKGYASMDYYHESAASQVLFIRKGGYMLHQRFENPYRALIFMFADASLKSFFAEYPYLLAERVATEADFMSQPVVLELPSSPFIASTFSSALDHLKHPVPESHVSLKLKFRELLVDMLREKRSNPFYVYLSWLCDDEKLSFMKLMRENAHCHFTIEELARVSGMSLSSFKRVFKGSFGMSPGKWLDQQRISSAIALLVNTSKTISEIAFDLGYSDASAFTRAFKRATDKNPAYYRRKHYSESK